MHVEDLRELLASLPASAEEQPFGPDVLVYRIGPGGKMFALFGIDDVPLRVNLKCDPDRAVALRDEYPDAVLPGYHMNKKQWNTVVIEGVPPALFRDLVQHSWDLIVASLPRRRREAVTGGAGRDRGGRR